MRAAGEGLDERVMTIVWSSYTEYEAQRGGGVMNLRFHRMGASVNECL